MRDLRDSPIVHRSNRSSAAYSGDSAVESEVWPNPRHSTDWNAFSDVLCGEGFTSWYSEPNGFGPLREISFRSLISFSSDFV